MKLTSKSVLTLGAVVVVMSVGGLTLSAQQGQGRGRGRAVQQYNTLAGTYELDRTQGDNPERAAQLATRSMPAAQRDQAYRNLLARLESPQSIAIERQGRTVRMGSTIGEATTFEADGVTRREAINDNSSNTRQANRANSIRATMIGERLSITSTGNRAQDFAVTFEPLQGGTRMLVTRQIWNQNFATPVIVRSYYTRVSTEPRWDLYTGVTVDPRGGTIYGDPNPNRPRDNRMGVVVPDGTRIFAILDSPIDTRTARTGDRFTMTVQGPNEYRDARIEGVIRSASVYSSERPADLIIDFDTIRMRNGQTSPIDATLDTVRKPGGELLRVDGSARTEPTRDRSDTAIQTGAIGAAIGGVIGVITGGTKGAVIGAVLGGAAGAGGAILANSRDRYLDLPIGTEVTIVASSPRGGN
jgi:uncharacterized protein YcfJ